MSTDHLSLPVLLQAHAAERPGLLAHVLPDRDITYRRLWSRIERASARLQGEWGVRDGDLVAYVGSAHPDAIVLYFALLRIGASLLPLEAMPVADAERACDTHRASLAIHDEGILIDKLPARPLEALLADWSHHEPVTVADDPARRALWLQSGAGRCEPVSLLELTVALPETARSAWIGECIFSIDVLIHQVLPSLRDARRLMFAATEPQQRTGS